LAAPIPPPPAQGEAVTYGLLAEIARRYYIEGETQDSIARALDLSRMKVNRMIKEAQEAGLVEIRVRFHSSQTRELERQLCDRFGLKHLLVSPASQSPQQQRRNVAMTVTHFLESNLRDNLIVAVGMGRNVAAVAEMQAARTFESLTFVSGSGGAAEAGSEGNADHICRNLARRFGGNAVTLYAPAYVPEAELRESLISNGTVRRTLNLARSADYALVGIGDLGPDSHMARMGWFSSQELRKAQDAGVVGDLMGYDFFDAHGKPCNDVLGGRVIGLSREDLQRISTTIAIAAEQSKAMAILGALRTGTIDVLATSLTNCLSIRDFLAAGH
jgi:DNA-binding transcriptional regulator LsrR (DeoR family)